ncbi:MAG: hypothetical protein FWF77_04825 [Defluviitaleaceae bacterium]|nr:hypothetical protein [Defluviitaleaceae bacterium]
MSRATRALEAGSNFPAHKKARQARIGHRGHVSEATHSLEAGSNFPAHKKILPIATDRIFITRSFTYTFSAISPISYQHAPASRQSFPRRLAWRRGGGSGLGF